jgi:hypothetical protein
MCRLRDCLVGIFVADDQKNFIYIKIECYSRSVAVPMFRWLYVEKRTSEIVEESSVRVGLLLKEL